MKKNIFRFLLAAIIITPIVCWFVSPYKQHEGIAYTCIQNTVEINASPEQVFAYLGNSAHAHDWSVFVDHISSLNSDSFADGAPGARRRCFQEANEQGLYWDELITEVEPNKRRQLTIYNMVNFPVKSEGLATEQLYEPLDGGKRCRLRFTMYYKNHEPTFWELVKTKFTAWRVQSVFHRNMDNIKKEIEHG